MTLFAFRGVKNNEWTFYDPIKVVPNLDKDIARYCKDASDHYAGMHRVQAAELFNDQKQEEYDRKVGYQEILPFLWSAQVPQGNEIEPFRR